MPKSRRGINCLAYLQANKTLWRERVEIVAETSEMRELRAQIKAIRDEAWEVGNRLWRANKIDEMLAAERAADARAEPPAEQLRLLLEQQEAELAEAEARQTDAYYSAYVYPAPGWEVNVSGYGAELVVIMARRERRACPAYVPR